MNIHKNLKSAAILVMAMQAASCAHTPDATVGYYLPKSVVSVKVLRTVACNDLDEPYIQVAATTTTSFIADRGSRRQFSIDKLGNSFANTSSKFTYYPDGRLSGMNAEGKGVGKDIVTAFLKVAAIAFGPGIAPAWGAPVKKNAFKKECAYIRDSTKDDVVTLVYEGKVDLDKAAVVIAGPGRTLPLVDGELDDLLANGQTYLPSDPKDAQALAATGVMPNPTVQLIPPAIQSVNDHRNLVRVFGDVCAVAIPQPEHERPVKPVLSVANGKTSFELNLREPALAAVAVLSGRSCVETTYSHDDVVDASRGRDYSIAVPKAAAFGRTKFALELQESGRLSSIAYEKDTGIGDAAGSLGEALGAFGPKSDATKAAEIHAEADLIAAQERLVRCRADSKNCGK